MCGSIKLSSIPANTNSIGVAPLAFVRQGTQLELVTQSGQTVKAVWNGFAQSESLQSWTSKGYQLATINGVSGYTERNRTTGLGGLFHTGARKIEVVVKDREFRIVTRPAVAMEKLYNNRFPRLK